MREDSDKRAELDDIEDEKETVEVDLRKVGITATPGNIERQLQNLSSHLSDLEDEKEEILRRLSMAIGDSKLAIENSNSSLRDIKKIRKENEKILNDTFARLDDFEADLRKTEEALVKINKIDAFMGEVQEKLQPLNESISALEEGKKELGSRLDEVNTGLGEVNEKFQPVQEKLSTLEEGRKELHAGIEEINAVIGGLEEKFKPVNENLNALEDGKKELHTRLDEVHEKFNPVNENISILLSEKEELKTRLESLNEVLASVQDKTGLLDTLRDKLETLEKSVETDVMEKIDSLKGSLNIEELSGFQDLKTSVESFCKEIDKVKKSLKSRLSSTEDGIEKIKGHMIINIDALDQKFRGFRSDVSDKLKELDKKVGDNVAEKITDFEQKFEDLRSAIGKSDVVKSQVLENLENLERKFNDFQGESAEKMAEFDKKVGENVAEKIQLFEQKFDEFRVLFDKTEELSGKLEAADGKIATVSGVIEGIDEKLSKVAEKVDTVEGRLADTDGKVEQIAAKTGEMEEKFSAGITKMDGVVKSIEKMEEEFIKFSDDYDLKIKDTNDRIRELLEERLLSVDDKLAEIKNKIETELSEKLAPLQEEVKGMSSDFDLKLDPFREEIKSAKSHLEEELIKVKESWEKLDKTLSDSNGAMEIASKARESLQRMEAEIAAAIDKVNNLMANLSENTLKTESNKEKIDLTIKLIDEARERIKNVNVPPTTIVGGPAAILDEEIIFTQSEINNPPDVSALGFELDDLLHVMIKHEASDLHLKAGSPPTVRMDGELIPVGSQILTDEDCKKLVFSAMTAFQRKMLGRKREVDFAYAIPEARFRVNAFLQKASVSASFRLLRTEIPGMDELHLPDVMKKLCDYNHGLILVTGPAGSGKSTTLASMINYINETKKMHIVTIEDPIEFVHQDKLSIITQREVGTDTESFGVALKQSLRQDPNVILIGEMRDPETIMTAVIAAETGHLVLSTLHTPNTVQAINRIIDVFAGDTQKQFRLLLANTLRGVVSQRLLSRVDESGRIPAVEVLVVTPTISSLVMEEKTGEIYSHMVQGATEGMQTFTQSLTALFEKGLISKEEAMYHADQPTEFRLSIEGHTTGSAAIHEDNLMSWL
ncbi:MAG: PilT/PilU family type 4a pilus ATPase [Firmicutes bacterium]|nr:PilT/PilU family type 4a pilus ATPase [Bacillota bacterium]